MSDKLHEQANKMQEYANSLKEKVANIPPQDLHIMKEEKTFKQDNFQDNIQHVLEDLNDFLACDLLDFQKYEKWLEDNGGADKTR